MTPYRLPTRISNGVPTSDGAGVRLTRLMGGDPMMPAVDPFLMLDYFDSPTQATTSPASRRIRTAASRR
jgi:redox-sensitive bicupin YhaK (pirin superfamily)